MKRTLWRWGWVLPLAALIGVGLIASGQTGPASDAAGGAPAVAPAQAASGPVSAVPTATGPGEVVSPPPAREPQPGVEEEGDEYSETQPGSAPAGTQPTSGSRPAGRGTASSRPAGGYTPYGNGNTFGRQRGNRNDRTGRTRGGSDVGPGPTSLPVFGPGTSWNDFSVVASRNIFIKDRSVRPPPGPEIVRPPTRVTGLILVGIALVEDPNARTSERVAFLEDSATGMPTRASAGQVLEGGRVLAVSLDGIQYQKGGVIKWISLGESLTGGRIDMATQPTAAPTEVTGATSTSAPGDGGGDSVLDRLRRRRQQELR